MKRFKTWLLLAISLLAVIAGGLAIAQQSIPVSGAPSPMLSGNGSPVGVWACSDADPSLANVEYLQLDASNGRFWLCDMSTGHWGWDHQQTVGPVGTDIVRLNQAGALTAQQICPADATCPAAFLGLYTYINVVTTGTLVSLVSASLTYTDDVATKTNVAIITNLSLLTLTQGMAVTPFYHAANTAVTVNTSVGTLTGSPSYNFRARLVQLGL